MSRSAWTTLGIAATGDETAIRRAYAAKLKTIDPDASPDAFIALRQALEHARAHAQQAADKEPEAAPEAIGPPEVPSSAAADAELNANTVAPPPVEKPAWLIDIEGVQDAVWSDRSREDIYPEVAERIARILAASEMDSIDHAARVEQWAADVIVQGIPRTNAMIGPAINRFDWAEREKQWNCPPGVSAVMRRYRDCLFADSLRIPGTRQYGALQRLQSASGQPDVAWLQSVNDLLRQIEHQHPTLRHELDEHAVAAWQRFNAARLARPVARFGRRVRELASPVRRYASTALRLFGRTRLLIFLIFLALQILRVVLAGN